MIVALVAAHCVDRAWQRDLFPDAQGLFRIIEEGLDAF
jgi:hypothetical protein